MEGERMHDELIAGAVAASRMEGCDCDPEVTLMPIAGLGPVLGRVIQRAEVAHDDWCRLLRAKAARSN